MRQRPRSKDHRSKKLKTQPPTCESMLCQNTAKRNIGDIRRWQQRWREASTSGKAEAMRAHSGKEPVQGVRRGEHLPAQLEKERVQGVRRGELMIP